MSVRSIIDLLEKIHQSKKLCMGGEQSPNSEELWEAIQELKKLALDNPELEKAIAEMDKSVLCLAIELPEPVWDDVSSKWQMIRGALVLKKP